MHKSVYDHDIPSDGTHRAETPDIAWRDFMNAAPKSAKGKLAKGMPEATDILTLLNAISTQVSEMQGTLDRYTPFIEDAMANKEKALEVESEMEELAFDLPPADDPFKGMDDDGGEDGDEKEDTLEEEEDESEGNDGTDESDKEDFDEDESDEDESDEDESDEREEDESAEEEEEDDMDKKARSNSKSADYEMSAEDFRAMCNDLHKAVRENERLRKMNVRQGMQIKSLEGRITKMEMGTRAAPVRKTADASVRGAGRTPAPVRKTAEPDASVRKRVRTYTPPAGADAEGMTKRAVPAPVVQRPPSTAGFRQVPVNVDAVNKAADAGADGKPARRDNKFKLGTPDEVLKNAFGG